MNDEEKVKEIKSLIVKYKNEIERLKENDSFKNDKKLQTVCVLREIINDLELIL